MDGGTIFKVEMTENEKPMFIHQCELRPDTYHYESCLNRNLQQIHEVVEEKPTIFLCHLCSATYVHHQSLTEHLREKHQVEEKPTAFHFEVEKKLTAFSCHLCSAKYVHQQSLTKHLREKHQEKVYKCSVCEASYARNKDLKDHWRVEHKTKKDNKMRRCLEKNCKEQFASRDLLFLHLEFTHGKKFIEEKLSFSAYSEFIEWKESLEKLQPSLFLLRNEKKEESKTTRYFYCNRSGNYEAVVDEKNRKRKLKSQGSCKIGQMCPARLIVVEKRNVTEVRACVRHYGHECKLEHVPLPQADKEVIQGKILLGLPKQEILQDIRSSFTSMENVERVHLTTWKDLSNMSQSLALDRRSASDWISADFLVQELERQENTEVLLYKQQGVVCSEGNFAKDDFVVAFCTHFMLEMLDKYGHKVVCMDSTYGTTAYDFKLVTAMVVDEFGCGVPVAWLLSNKDGSEVLLPFLRSLREAFEKTRERDFPCPKYFMTDEAPQFYVSWCSISKSSPEKLLCSWHVHRDWVGKLNSLIQDYSTRQKVYQKLVEVSQCPDSETATSTMAGLLKNLEENSQTSNFGLYIRREGLPCFKEWCAANREDAGINTNMYLEAFHEVFKYTYLNGRHNGVDKCLQSLVSYSSDMKFKRIENVEKRRNSWRQTQTDQHHSQALNTGESANIEQLDENTWKVQSLKSSEKCYRVEISRCTSRQCRECHARCSLCNCCAHTHSCTCLDYLIRGFVCKHIHLICMRFPNDNSSSTASLQECDTLSEPKLMIKKVRTDWEKKARQLCLSLSGKLERRGLNAKVCKEICKKLECCITMTKFSFDSKSLHMDKKSRNLALKKIAVQRKFKSTKGKLKAGIKRKSGFALKKDKSAPSQTSKMSTKSFPKV